MVKALEILINLNNSLTDYDHTLENEITEAIKELEELKNRSCNNCRFFSLEYENIGICPFLTCPKVDYYVDKDFCCNKWECKE